MKWFAQRGSRVAIVEARTEGAARLMATDLLSRRMDPDETDGMFTDPSPRWTEGSIIRPATDDEVRRFEAVREQTKALRRKTGEQLQWDIPA